MVIIKAGELELAGRPDMQNRRRFKSLMATDNFGDTESIS